MFHLYKQELEQQAATYEMYVFDHITEKPMILRQEKPFYVEFLQAIALLCAWIVIVLVLFTKW